MRTCVEQHIANAIFFSYLIFFDFVTCTSIAICDSRGCFSGPKEHFCQPNSIHDRARKPNYTVAKSDRIVVLQKCVCVYYVVCVFLCIFTLFLFEKFKIAMEYFVAMFKPISCAFFSFVILCFIVMILYETMSNGYLNYPIRTQIYTNAIHIQISILFIYGFSFVCSFYKLLIV